MALGTAVPEHQALHRIHSLAYLYRPRFIRCPCTEAHVKVVCERIHRSIDSKLATKQTEPGCALVVKMRLGILVGGRHEQSIPARPLPRG